MSDILEENNNYRVSLEYDLYPDQPYDDGGWPIVRIGSSRYTWRDSDMEHVDSSGRNRRADDSVEKAIRKWGTPSSNDWPLVEKFLRAYLGVTQVHTYRSDDYWYVAYDSADWREYAGFTDDMRADDGYWPYRGANPLTEWKAWINGEVYFYTVERKVHVYQDQRRHGPGTFETVSTEFDEWEHVDSCGGFYGYDYAREAALEAFHDAQED